MSIIAMGLHMPSVGELLCLAIGFGLIAGVRKDTRQDATWYCEADSAENAKVKAELEGIIVTGIERA